LGGIATFIVILIVMIILLYIVGQTELANLVGQFVFWFIIACLVIVALVIGGLIILAIALPN